MDYYLFTGPKGMEGSVGLVYWSIMDSLRIYTHCIFMRKLSIVDQQTIVYMHIVCILYTLSSV